MITRDSRTSSLSISTAQSLVNPYSASCAAASTSKALPEAQTEPLSTQLSKKVHEALEFFFVPSDRITPTMDLGYLSHNIRALALRIEDADGNTHQQSQDCCGCMKAAQTVSEGCSKLVRTHIELPSAKKINEELCLMGALTLAQKNKVELALLENQYHLAFNLLCKALHFPPEEILSLTTASQDPHQNIPINTLFLAYLAKSVSENPLTSALINVNDLEKLHVLNLSSPMTLETLSASL